MKLKARVHQVDTYQGETVIVLNVKHAYEDADGVRVEQAPFELAKYCGNTIDANLEGPKEE